MSNRLNPDQLIEAAMYHRTLNVLYDVLHESDNRGLKMTMAALDQVRAALILIRRRRPDLPYPIIVVLPVNE